MDFNRHSHLEGKHAFLSPSNYHWLNYDDQKLHARFISAQSAKRGTDLHNLACDLIRLGQVLPDEPLTMNLYVNDAIFYGMSPEVMLFYSQNCFGQADAVSFRNDMLRVHDLKTGLIKSSFRQLHVYAALFCLEYGVNPFDIGMELRIYQRDEVLIEEPTAELIVETMDIIVEHDRKIVEFEEVQR